MPSPAAAHAEVREAQLREWPWGVRCALVGLGYFVLARLGLAFATVTANITPVWPPSGLALAALIIGGVRLWPGVACGALAAALSSGASVLAAVLMAMGNTLEAVVTVVLLRRLFSFRDNFEHPRQVVGFIVLLGGVGTPLSAVLGTLAALSDGTVGRERVLLALLTWGGGNFAGGLVLGPLLIVARELLGRLRAFAAVFELSCLLALLAFVGSAVFLWSGPRGFAHPVLLVLPFPLLVWIAWRFAIGGAALALLVLGTFAVWGTAGGTGPLTGRSAPIAFAYLLIYVVVVALTALVLASFNAQRERLVARLRQREWQLSEAQRIANLGVWMWDLRHDDFQFSAGALRVLGLAREHAATRPETLRNCIVPADRPLFEELLRQVRAGDDSQTCDLRIRRPDGAERHVTTTCAALRDSRGEPSLLLGTLFDFTERKRSEDERAAWHRKLLETQKLESLGLLAGGIAHDFNNLLTGVLGNASLLRLQLPAGSPLYEGLRRIEGSAQRAAELCRQMLAYSGKGRFVVRPVDLNEMVHGTLGLAKNSVPKKAEVTFQAGEPAPRVRADMLQMRQLLLNLVVNAIEALPDSGGEVVVRTGTMTVGRDWLAHAYLAPELALGDYAFLEVADNGTGIDPAAKERIFDPFFSTKFTGRGLGLAAVAGIVRVHHGAVRVSSEPGRGATFCVIFPPAGDEAAAQPALSVGSAPAPVAAPPPPEAAAAPATREGLWLVVDDEPAVRQVAAEFLGRSGLSAVAADDGFKALTLFGPDGRGFQAVLLDYSMPQIDGVETLKRLRAVRPDIPIVLMSGFDQEEALERFAGLGLAGYLQKPFTMQALRAAVAAVPTRTAGAVR